MSGDLAQLAIWLLGSTNEPSKTALVLQPQMTASSLVEQARYHKVAEITATNIQYLNTKRSVGTDMQKAAVDLVEEVKKERENSTPLLEEFTRLQDFCHAKGLVVHIIKGKKREPIYLSPYTRHSGDIDLLVPDIETAGLIIEWLRNHGYDWDPEELPWFKKWTPGGDSRLYGQVPLIREDTISKQVFRYDLHFGGYSIGDSSFLPFEDICASWEGELVILLGHALGEGFFNVKDLNDWRMIATTQSIDWDRVSRFVEQTCLMPVLRAMEHLDKWQSRFQSEPQTSLPRCTPICYQKYGRSSRVAYHTFVVSRKLNGSVIASLRRAVESFVYYSLDHSPQTRCKFIRSPRFEEGTIDRWNCWRLIPVNKPVKGSIDFWGAYFWPTVWYDVPGSVLSEIVV